MASQFNSICKHQLNLLLGDVTNLVENGSSSLCELHDLLLQSNLADDYRQFSIQPSDENKYNLKKAFQHIVKLD